MGLLNDVLGTTKSRNAPDACEGDNSCVECRYFETIHEDMLGNFHGHSYCKLKKLKIHGYQKGCSSFVQS